MAEEDGKIPKWNAEKIHSKNEIQYKLKKRVSAVILMFVESRVRSALWRPVGTTHSTQNSGTSLTPTKPERLSKAKGLTSGNRL